MQLNWLPCFNACFSAHVQMTEQRKNKQRIGFLGPSQMNHQIPHPHWELLIVPLHTHSHTDADVHTMNNTTLMVILHFTPWHYSCPVRSYRLDRRFVSVFPFRSYGRRTFGNIQRVFVWKIMNPVHMRAHFFFFSFF